MQLTFIGCGDAFGSGGRLTTCFHVGASGSSFLIDCGASSLVGLKARGVNLNEIRSIFVTHFHADHSGGIPFFILDAKFSRRTSPLTVVGPPGLELWFEKAMESSFPGSSATVRKFPLALVEIAPGREEKVAGVTVKAFQAQHGAPQGPFLSYRITADGKTIAYTGDTEWTDELIGAASDADLFIAEAYSFEKKIKFHLDLQSLADKLPLIRPRRLVLTHMSPEMLERSGDLPFEAAYDGMTMEV